MEHEGGELVFFIVGSSSFQYRSLVLFAIFREYVLISGHKEPWTLSQLQMPLSPWPPPPLLSQEPSSGYPFSGFVSFRIAELQMTLAPAAGASMTSTCDSFQDLTPERSPFPVDCGGFTHANALFCHCHRTLCQERGNSSACKSMSLAQRVLCWVVLS